MCVDHVWGTTVSGSIELYIVDALLEFIHFIYCCLQELSGKMTQIVSEF